MMQLREMKLFSETHMNGQMNQRTDGQTDMEVEYTYLGFAPAGAVRLGI